jgi:hypothetical protein
LSLQDRETANVGAGLWKGTGMWAWILFRISGLVLAFYLFVHIGVISQGRASGAHTLNRIFTTFDKPLFVFLDLMGVGIRSHKTVFWVLMTIAAVLLGVFVTVAFPYIF